MSNETDATGIFKINNAHKLNRPALKQTLETIMKTLESYNVYDTILMIDRDFDINSDDINISEKGLDEFIKNDYSCRFEGTGRNYYTSYIESLFEDVESNQVDILHFLEKNDISFKFDYFDYDESVDYRQMTKGFIEIIPKYYETTNMMGTHELHSDRHKVTITKDLLINNHFCGNNDFVLWSELKNDKELKEKIYTTYDYQDDDDFKKIHYDVMNNENYIYCIKYNMFIQK